MDTDRSWAILLSVWDSQRFADTKAGVALAVNGLLGSLTVPMLTSAHDHEPVRFTLAAVALASIVASVAMCLRTLIPRFPGPVPPGMSLIYFGDFANVYRDDPDGYTSAHLELIGDPARLATQISQQVWANGLIAQKKFNASSWALRLLATGLLLAGAALAASGLRW